MANNFFPHHNQTVAIVGAPPETPKMLKQSQDRLKALGVWRTGLIAGVDLTITSVNTALGSLKEGSPEFKKLAKYMQRCIDHKNRILQAMELLASEEISNQKFMGFWVEQRELPDYPKPTINMPINPEQKVDPNLPIGPEGKPVGKMRSDGVVDIGGDSTTAIPIDGVLSKEQAEKLGVTGKPGPNKVIAAPVITDGMISDKEQKEYIKLEEDITKVPAKNVAGNGRTTI